MAGDITKLKAGVPWTTTKWQEMPIHRVQSHRYTDDMQWKSLNQVSKVIM